MSSPSTSWPVARNPSFSRTRSDAALSGVVLGSASAIR